MEKLDELQEQIDEVPEDWSTEKQDGYVSGLRMAHTIMNTNA